MKIKKQLTISLVLMIIVFSWMTISTLQASVPNGSGVQRYNEAIEPDNEYVWVIHPIRMVSGHLYCPIFPYILGDHFIPVGTWVTFGIGFGWAFNTSEEAQEMLDTLWPVEVDVIRWDLWIDNNQILSIEDSLIPYLQEEIEELRYIDDPNHPNYEKYMAVFQFRYYLPPQSRGTHIISVTEYWKGEINLEATGEITWTPRN